MFFKVLKVLLVSLALLFVAAKAEDDAFDNEENTGLNEEEANMNNEAAAEDELMDEAEDDGEVPENDSVESVQRDPRRRRPIRKPKPFFPCPFNCYKVCVREVFVNNQHFYKSVLPILKCCRKCCKWYSFCRAFGQPDWVCYQRALDCNCRCRGMKRVKPVKPVKPSPKPANVTTKG